jgi:SAM-dependent methyltransferase
MTEPKASLEAGYFEELYAGAADPWGFRSSPYEREKYGETLAILPRARYGSVLEIGCSIGVFTRRLAERCDTVLALDGSARALAEAKNANADLSWVTFREGMVPQDFPEGRYDLIVLSEVLYYLAPSDLRRVADLCLASLEPDGHMVLCHWLGETNYPLSGDEAADLFIQAVAPRWRPTSARREPEYRLDLLAASA